MPIKATCSNCDRTYTLADAMAGRKLKCKDCGATFAAAAPAPRPRKPAAPPADERPRKKAAPRSGGGLLWWLVGSAAALFLLCVAGGGVLAVLIMMQPGNKATPENFAKLKHGMSEKDLTNLLGPPQPGAALNHPVTKGALDLPAGVWYDKALVWHGQGDAEFVVLVKDGQVAGAVGSDGRNIYAPLMDANDPNGQPLGILIANNNQKPDPNAKPIDPKALAEGFGKVRPGMSEQQVVALLGPATNTNVIPPQQLGDEQLPEARCLNWGRLSGDHARATFREDKLESGGATIDGKSIDLTRPDEPKVDPKALAENFGKVREGMSEKEVVALLGKPSQANRFPAKQVGDFLSPAAAVLRWGALKGDNVSVHFEDDKVTTGSGLINGKNVGLNRGDAFPDVNVNPNKGKMPADAAEKFAKIREGMTEKEVVALLGEGNSITFPAGEAFGKRTPARTVMTWGNVFGGDHITATLEDGKLVDASGRVNDKDLIMGFPDQKPDPGKKPVDVKALADGVAKLRLGMTEKQVTDLLGPPANTADFPARVVGGRKVPAKKHLLWGAPEWGNLTIILSEDKLESGIGFINGKPVKVGAP
jgi:outer membrane protein assembly factor BamE (lipoprotein component of BamABCDE complex)